MDKIGIVQWWTKHGHAKGWLELLIKSNEIKFYGDRMDKGGNDYSLAMAIREKGLGETFHVYDWKHTWELLEYETSLRSGTSNKKKTF